MARAKKRKLGPGVCGSIIVQVLVRIRSNEENISDYVFSMQSAIAELLTHLWVISLRISK
jgi:hypothetical protein